MRKLLPGREPQNGQGWLGARKAAAGRGGCVRAQGLGVAGCGGARCPGGRWCGEQGGGGGGSPEVRRAGRGIPRGVRAGGEVFGSGAALRRGRREEGLGGGEMRRRGRAPGEGAPGGGRGGAGWAAGRPALGRGAELVGPGGRSGQRRRGAGAARRPPLPPGLELSGLGGGCSRWEVGAGGRGWLHRGSHSASSSRRRRHCVLSAPVARCGAPGGGPEPRPRAEDRRSPSPRRQQGFLAWGRPLVPGPDADARALRAEVPGAPAGRAQCPGPRRPGGPCGCVCRRAIPRGPGVGHLNAPRL